MATFSAFISGDLKRRPSQAITIPAPASAEAIVESEIALSSTTRRDTLRAPAFASELAAIENAWGGDE